MNRILVIICLSLLLSCNTKKETEKIVTIGSTDTIKKDKTQQKVSQKEYGNTEFDSTSNKAISLKNEFKNFEITNLKDTIKADLNGDKVLDFAFFKNTNNKIELFVLDGKSNKKIKIGQDKSFGEMGEDFSWVEFWGTTEDKETFKVLVDDSEIVGDTIVKLINKSIFVRKEEVGGGVITYNDNRFIWIHQSD